MSSLGFLLNDMLYDANVLKKRDISRKLQNGLRITVFNDVSSLILTIARDDVYPSKAEWITVMNHMPYRVSKALEPQQEMLRDGWRALRGRVPNETMEQLKFV